MINLFLFLLLCGCNANRKIASIDPTIDFKKVLITGASISANWNGVSSPGLKIANAYNSEVNIKAHGGKKSEVILSDFDQRLKNNYSVIIALDLFFWDSVSNNCDKGLSQIDNFINKTKNKNIKVLIGNIPPLVSSMNCRTQLNNHLESKCIEANSCYLFDFDTLVHELQRADRSKYFQKDKIHLTSEGSIFAAKEILKNLEIYDHPEIK